MKEELISSETAVLAKEKGFNEYCRYRYDKPSNNLRLWSFHEADEESWHDNSSCVGESAPTQSHLQKWLRDVKGVHLTVNVGIPHGSKSIMYYVNVIKMGKHHKSKFRGSFKDTFEQALEEGLKEALK
tara:strand:+ start:1752 stop:2135 length:384 start_codon:yes stop_codon:yes gene_type:complete